MAVRKQAEAVASVIFRIKCAGMKALVLLLNHVAAKADDDFLARGEKNFISLCEHSYSG